MSLISLPYANPFRIHLSVPNKPQMHSFVPIAWFSLTGKMDFPWINEIILIKVQKQLTNIDILFFINCSNIYFEHSSQQFKCFFEARVSFQGNCIHCAWMQAYLEVSLLWRCKCFKCCKTNTMFSMNQSATVTATIIAVLSAGPILTLDYGSMNRWGFFSSSRTI